MQEINEVLSETEEYTETNTIEECFICGVVREASQCKLCNPQVNICNSCRPDHMFGPEHYKEKI